MNLQRSLAFLICSMLVQSLTACEGSATPFGTPRSSRQNDSSTSGDLLYVSDPSRGVSFYSYPGLTLEGKLSDLQDPTALCVDPRTTNVWVVSFESTVKVSEFAHGATKSIYTIEPDLPDIDACAVNPTNGDLALAMYNEYDDAGALVVFHHASGKPVLYRSKHLFFYSFVGYDASGNAFVDGGSGFGDFELVELAAGAKKLTDVTPRHARLQPPREGGVQFDGTNLAVGDERHGRIYQISNREVVGVTKLAGTCLVRGFAIDNDALIAPSACDRRGTVLVYDYPAGGAPIASITGFRGPYAVAISP